MNSIVALPIAAAVPTSSPLLAAGGPDRQAMHAYASWLFMERRILCDELWPHLGKLAERWDYADNAGYYWHCEGPGSWKDKPQPSSRAAAVLDLVGVNWRASDDRFDCGLDHTDTGYRPAVPLSWPIVDGELLELAAQVLMLQEEADAMQPRIADLTLQINAIVNDKSRGKSRVTDAVFSSANAEHNAAAKKQNALLEQADDLVLKMWEIPARTVAGKQAKVEVLLKHCLVDEEWHLPAQDAPWEIGLCLRLLAELSGAKASPAPAQSV